MARVFEQAIEDVAVASGLEWTFVMDMYHHIVEQYGRDADFNQLAHGILKRDWRVWVNWGEGRFRNALEDWCKHSGYEYDYLFDILVDLVYDPDDDITLDGFVAITMEHDW